jgi:uncharacterized tellurite resistance protein B-like protein
MSAYPEDPHPARALPTARRLEYLHAVAAMVHADGRVDDLEVEVLRRLGAVMELDDAQLDEMVRSVRAPDRARIDAILESFACESLRIPLLGDAILVAFADGRVAASESKEVAEYANALRIDLAQAVLIARYVEEVLVRNDGGELSKALAEGLADAASQIHPPRGVKWLYRKLTEN